MIVAPRSPRGRQRQVAPDLVLVGDGQRVGGLLHLDRVGVVLEDGDGELAGGARVAAADGRGESERRVAGTGPRPGDRTVGRDDVGLGARPGDVGAALARRRQGQVVGDGRRVAQVQGGRVGRDPLAVRDGTDLVHLVRGQGAVVDADVAHRALEVLVRAVERPAEVVGGRRTSADVAGLDGDAGLARHLVAVLVEHGRATGQRVRDVPPHAPVEVAGPAGGLLGRPVARRDRRPVAVAGGEQVAVAGTRGAVAQAVDEVRRRLGGVDPHVHRDGDRVQPAHQVVRQVGVAVGAAEGQALTLHERRSPGERRVAVVARRVVQGRAGRLVQRVVHDQAVIDAGGGRRSDRRRQGADGEECGERHRERACRGAEGAGHRGVLQDCER